MGYDLHAFCDLLNPNLYLRVTDIVSFALCARVSGSASKLGGPSCQKRLETLNFYNGGNAIVEYSRIKGLWWSPKQMRLCREALQVSTTVQG